MKKKKRKEVKKRERVVWKGGVDLLDPLSSPIRFPTPPFQIFSFLPPFQRPACSSILSLLLLPLNTPLLPRQPTPRQTLTLTQVLLLESCFPPFFPLFFFFGLYLLMANVLFSLLSFRVSSSFSNRTEKWKIKVDVPSSSSSSSPPPFPSTCPKCQ
jgi:hypothetical protein